jgi:hypothetical protein
MGLRSGIMEDRKSLTLLEIQNIMLETLAYKGDDIDCEGKNFYKYDYQGTRGNLFNLMESLAIKKGLINCRIKVAKMPWGCDIELLHPNSTTNFNKGEIKKIFESFHEILNRGIIAPGGVGNYGFDLPNFHVTEYGLNCLENIDILPYDSEGYLSKLNDIKDLDDWVKFYINQALECFNSYCYEAALIMVGLANEFIIEEVIKNYIIYLDIKNKDEKIKFENSILKINKISQKYSKYLISVDNIKNKDKDLKEIQINLDKLATNTFMSYMRLTRNELSHPANLKTDRITTLMIFISFVSYCERQYKFINYYKSKNNA